MFRRWKKVRLSCTADVVTVAQNLIVSHEETFDLFSQDLPSQNLGFVDSKSHVLELTVGGHDLTIHQSPAILSSNRAGGTTGAGKSSTVVSLLLLRRYLY